MAMALTMSNIDYSMVNIILELSWVIEKIIVFIAWIDISFI